MLGPISRTALHLRTNAARSVALVCAALLVPAGTGARAQPAPQAPTQQPAQAAAEPAAATIPADQLDSLVAPIALYPDPLLSQTLVASTYPLEIIQLQQWLEKNKNLKDKALTDAALKQPWDPSIQAMVVLPDVVSRLANDIQWTTDLGNAFLAQQSDVMDAVQRMRKKAQGTGALTSNEQQKVETKVVENKTVVVVEPASTEVVYVPSYSPTVVYGPPIYPYPPIYYPPYPTGAVDRQQHDLVRRRRRRRRGVGRRRLGLGLRMGRQRHRHQREQQFRPQQQHQRNTNVSGNRVGQLNKWQHNSAHRGGAPYANRATADRYGGTARGDSLASRQSSARTAAAQSGADRQAGAGERTAGARDAGANRSAGVERGREGRGANRSGGGGDRVGSREVPRSSGSPSSSAFSGSSGGGNRANASSSRGSQQQGWLAAAVGGGGRRR